jgi:hypothetical protein
MDTEKYKNPSHIIKPAKGDKGYQIVKKAFNKMNYNESEGHVSIDSVNGMGAPTLPTRTEQGSGDVPNVPPKKKKVKNKIKTFDEFDVNI